MIYAKLKNETEIEIAPVNFIDEDGRTYLNFNLSVTTLSKFGFKPLDESNKPDGTDYDVTYIDHDEKIEAVYTLKIPEKTEDEIKRDFIDAVQDHMDGIARTRGYDNIFTACTYSASTVEKFAKEASICIEFRDAVWSYCYEQLDRIIAGERSIPTIDDFISELPEIRWQA